jgi:predicted nuclease of predicted toxin-antitoxin system
VKIHFQADEDFNEDIVSGVLRRVPEIDFQTSREANLESLHDLEVLAAAAREGRVLVTHDRKTMPRHFGRFIETDVSPGVFIVSQRAGVPEIIEELILIWVASETEEYTNSIRTLPL